MGKVKPLQIGSLRLKSNIICAPLCDVTDYCYRRVLHKEGCALVYTEMLSSEALIRLKRWDNYRYLENHPDVRPFGVQISGKDPVTIAEVVRKLDTMENVDLIDLNMGCPVRKIISKGSGSALLKSPDRVEKIFKYMRAATTKPLTVKIRAGWRDDSINCVEIAQMAEAEGLDAITIHARTAASRADGPAKWEYIKMVKDAVSIPVIGNGDIFSAADAKRMLTETGCDGVMVARGAMGNPWIFREIENSLSSSGLTRGSSSKSNLERKLDSRLRGNDNTDKTSTVSVNQKRETILYHMELLKEKHNEHYVVISLKKFLGWYTKGLPFAKYMMQRVYHSKESAFIRNEINRYFDLLNADPEKKLLAEEYHLDKLKAA